VAAAFLRLQHLTKQFGSHAAVRDVSLDVPRGKVLALLGPSGSGKTTTLRLLAGFESPDTGSITVDGRDVTSLPAAVRRFGMVFQHYALFPHLDVGENVGFGLAGVPAAQRERRVAEVLALVDLTGFERRAVTALSGGQQQRVAVARALAPEPRMLLLDEPLSNLDPTLRERTRRELRTALDRTGITTVFVTHEQEEAFALGDLVAVLNAGRLEQIGTPPELYDEPATLFVATFVGRASVVRGTVIAPGIVRVAEGVEWPAGGDPTPSGEAVSVVVRPEALQFTDGPGIGGTVTERRYVGARAFFRVAGDGVALEVEAPVGAAEVGAPVRVAALRARMFRT
jgi:ABC-type Fe3+/spermidine/putrescine transport system ATPase subunit